MKRCKIKNPFERKLKGGVLYYSLLVVILSSSIVLSILLSSYFQNRILIDTIKQHELESITLSAINLFLAGETIFKDNDTVSISLYADQSDNVKMSNNRWGNYTIIKADSHSKNISYSRRALVGSDIWTQENIALFMADEGRNLSLSGNTILKGTCYLPGGNARIASVEGQQYIYNKLVFGEVKESPPKLPALNNDLFDFALRYLENIQLIDDSVIYMNSLDTNYIENSFNNKTILLYNDELTELANYSLEGNIIIWSTIPLIIDKSMELEDIILFAPSITVKSGFVGDFQAYALQQIKIEKNCHIRFPSQLNIIQSEVSLYNPSDTLMVTIDEGSTIEGAILIKSSGLLSFISIDKTARAFGQVYCPGIIELKGEIIGSLYCKTFYLGAERAKYYNNLLNTRIDFMSLSHHFSGVDLIAEIPYKSIIKWLY